MHIFVHMGKCNLIYAAIFVSLSLCVSCGSHDTGNRSGSVEVVECASVSMNCGGEYDGIVRPHRMVDISSRAEGVLKARLFDEGAEIEKGQPLFLIDPTVYRARVNEASANLEKARANLLKATRDLERIRPLYAANAASRLDLDNATAVYEGARADVTIGEAQLALARVALDDTRILAPISGFISQSNKDVGAYIDPGSGPLARMINADTVNVEFSLTAEQYARSRARGFCFDAHCTNPAHERVYHVLVTNADGTPYPHEGTVDFAAHMADPENGRITVRAILPNLPHTLIPGAKTRVRVLGSNKHTFLTLPAKAVVVDDTGQYVMVEDGAGFMRREVITTPLSVDSVIVEKGLSAGEKVAIVDKCVVNSKLLRP